MLRTCLRISIRILFYQRKFTSKLMKTWRTSFTKHFDLHVNICSLNQIFSLCYLFFRHASYNNTQSKSKASRKIFAQLRTFFVIWINKNSIKSIKLSIFKIRVAILKSYNCLFFQKFRFEIWRKSTKKWRKISIQFSVVFFRIFHDSVKSTRSKFIVQQIESSFRKTK